MVRAVARVVAALLVLCGRMARVLGRVSLRVGQSGGRRLGVVLSRQPRSTLALGAANLAVLVAIGLVSCTLVPERPLTDRIGDEPIIRVRMAAGADHAELTGTVSFEVRAEPGSGVSDLAGPLLAEAGPRGIGLTDLAGRTRWYGAGIPVRVRSVNPVIPIVFNNVPLPGDVILTPRSEVAAGAFDVVAETRIESYLPGVIAKELYPNWPAETFRAQAIAARTYALHERQRARVAGRHYDVESNTTDQVFAGLTDNATANDAVYATHGQVLTYNGKLLRTYYSSTAGGRAASAADVWPTGPGFEYNLAGPLQASPRAFADEASPAYRWSRTRGVASLSKRIRTWGANNGHPTRSLNRLTRVEVERRNPVGRPASYVLTDERGQRFSLSAEQLRIACNSDAPGLDGVTRERRVLSGDLEVRLVGDTAEITGRGFGHGVGLCQWSAKGLADQGWAHREILANFYPGARLVRAY